MASSCAEAGPAYLLHFFPLLHPFLPSPDLVKLLCATAGRCGPDLTSPLPDMRSPSRICAPSPGWPGRGAGLSVPGFARACGRWWPSLGAHGCWRPAHGGSWLPVLRPLSLGLAMVAGCDGGQLVGVPVGLRRTAPSRRPSTGTVYGAFPAWCGVPPPPWRPPRAGRSGAATSPSGLVELSGSSVAIYFFMVCRFSGESLDCAGDDGVVGIIFLHGGITMRTSTCGDRFR